MFNKPEKQELPIYYFGESSYLNYVVFCRFLKKNFKKRLFDNIWLLLLLYKEIWKLDLQ